MSTRTVREYHSSLLLAMQRRKSSFISNAFRIAMLFAAIAACLGLPPYAMAQTLTTLHTFTGGADGGKPGSNLIQGSDGNFYGTTSSGGNGTYPAGNGTVYRITPGGELTTFFTFSGGDDGSSPHAKLVQGTDGNFYGTTYYGGDGYGVAGHGTVFRLTPDGSLTTLHTFSGGADGGKPNADLVQGSDGNFYGTTAFGGGPDGGKGTVFRITPGGVLTTLHIFAETDGADPNSSLIQGSDGNFYGTTYAGGPNDLGTVFQITNSGVLTTLHFFTGKADGEQPVSGLALGSNGRLYGTTLGGSHIGYGTVYCITSAGALTTLYNFSGGTDGDYPEGNLTLGSDGSFYGVTADGSGSSRSGTVFRITLAGVLTTLYDFTGTAAVPTGDLIQDGDGNFYETTYNGGSSGNGTVFRLSMNTWSAQSIAAGTDGKTRLLWTKADGSASFWTVPSAGAIVHSATYGPFADWTARKIAPGPSGATDIYWTTSGGGASYWQVSSSGAITYSPTWGPYAGWTPKDFSANGDGSARLLWTSPNGAASFWTIAANGSIKHSPTYGPYGGWTTAHIASAPGGATRLLWNNSNGSASVWSVAANGSVAYSPTYGPFAGWSCANIGVGGDGKTKLQWNNGDATSFWTLGANSTVAYSPVWGPFSGWSPSDFAVAPDNSVRLLWNSPSGAASFWNVSPGYGVGYSATYGPF